VTSEFILRLRGWQWEDGGNLGGPATILRGSLLLFYDFLFSIQFNCGVQYADVSVLAFPDWRRNDL
jgi:hypothetical protein